MTESAVREWPLIGARAAFLAVIATVIAVHGGTQAATKQHLALIMTGVVLIYAPALLVAGPMKTNRTSRFCMGLALLALALGWMSALFPRSVYDEENRMFLPLAAGQAWPWGSVDGQLSFVVMIQVTAAVATLLMAFEISAVRRWSKRLVLLLVGLGSAVSLLGMLQRTSGDVFAYWGGINLPMSVFGCFWYHGNAGAFLNLIWPLAAAGLLSAMNKLPSPLISQQFRVAGWLFAVLFIIAGVWINISKAAQAVFVFQAACFIVVWIFYSRGRQRERGGGSSTLLRWSSLVAVVLPLVAIMMVFGMENSLQRWESLAAKEFDDARWKMAQLCIPWIKDADWLGFGPGSFAALAVVKSDHVAHGLYGQWQSAHNDYLQLVLEWGWLGAVLWLSLAVGVLGSLISNSIKLAVQGHWDAFIGQSAMFISLISVGLHAAVDFPLQMLGIQVVAASIGGLALGSGVRGKLYSQNTGNGRGHGRMQ